MRLKVYSLQLTVNSRQSWPTGDWKLSAVNCQPETLKGFRCWPERLTRETRETQEGASPGRRETESRSSVG